MAGSNTPERPRTGTAATPATRRAAASTSRTTPAPATAKSPAKAPAGKAGDATARAAERPATRTPRRATATAAPRTDAPSAAAAAPAAPLAPRPLRERDPRDLAVTTGLALAAVVAEAVEVVSRLPEQVERLRAEAAPRTERVPVELRAGLGRVEQVVGRELDALAVRGRTVVDTVVARPEVAAARRRAVEVLDAVRRRVGPADRRTPSA